ACPAIAPRATAAQHESARHRASAPATAGNTRHGRGLPPVRRARARPPPASRSLHGSLRPAPRVQRPTPVHPGPAGPAVARAASASRASDRARVRCATARRKIVKKGHVPILARRRCTAARARRSAALAPPACFCEDQGLRLLVRGVRLPCVPPIASLVAPCALPSWARRWLPTSIPRMRTTPRTPRPVEAHMTETTAAATPWG